jgi:cellulose synthase/poly-beta-1,6-N-acetylglucosamine synthase-like glycosyltransferase
MLPTSANPHPPQSPAGRAPRVGVLINNTNNGPWLRATVDSVLARTRPADEITVYDGGSTDDSLSILRSYGNRIRLIEGMHDATRPGTASQGAAIARGCRPILPFMSLLNCRECARQFTPLRLRAACHRLLGRELS